MLHDKPNEVAPQYQQELPEICDPKGVRTPVIVFRGGQPLPVNTHSEVPFNSGHVRCGVAASMQKSPGSTFKGSIHINGSDEIQAREVSAIRKTRSFHHQLYVEYPQTGLEPDIWPKTTQLPRLL